MGFFDLRVVCAVCDKKNVGLNRYRIADKKWIFPSCFNKAGFKKVGVMEVPIRQVTVEYALAAIEARKPNNKRNSNVSLSAADEIIKFKELLDDEILTQEEFDAKKKELLGL